MRQFTAEQLAEFDGTSGKPTYVAYNGKVYDVSEGPNWDAGAHYEHMGGEDHTEAMQDAPHGDEVFEDFTVVGELID